MNVGWGANPETSPRFSDDMLSEISRLAISAHNRPYCLTVIPAKAGIYRQHEAWIPAFAGMTFGLFLCGPPA
jgi:hypothetical protein